MSYYFWLGRDADVHHDPKAAMQRRLKVTDFVRAWWAAKYR